MKNRLLICLSLLTFTTLHALPAQAQDFGSVLPQMAAAQQLQRNDLMRKGNAAIIGLKSYYAANKKLPQQTAEMDNWLQKNYRNIIGTNPDASMFVNSAGQQRTLGILRIMADPRAAQQNSDGQLPGDWSADSGSIVVVVGSDSKAVVYFGIGAGATPQDFKVVDCAPENSSQD